MPIFTYQGFDKYGNKVLKSTEATNIDILSENLLKSGYTITSIKEAASSINIASIDEFFKNLTKVKTNDLVMFTVQLANMLDAGLPLPAALSTIAEQTENYKMRSAISDITENIKQGKTFSESMAKHNDIFSNIFINMVAIGELAGNLDEMLTRLAGFIEHETEIKQKISSAMMYPVILMVAGVVVVSFVTVTMLPPFVKIFMDSGVPLPLPTKVLYGLNLFIRQFWLIVIISLGAAWIGIKQWEKTAVGKMRIDTIKLAIPAWGELIKKVEIARLCRTLATLLSSGVPMLQALEVTEKTIDTAPIALIINKLQSAVGKGRNISDSLMESKFFPPMPIHMISVGEETGTLEKMLNKIADFYDLSTDYAIKKLTGLLEPAFLVIIASLVGFIFAAILLPIFQMVKTLKH